jgi:hypothetical protein
MGVTAGPWWDVSLAVLVRVRRSERQDARGAEAPRRGETEGPAGGTGTRQSEYKTEFVASQAAVIESQQL